MGQFLPEKQLLEQVTLHQGHCSFVVTNGCFDILHVGHLRYLQACKAMGDRLVVLINTDESVRRLKGATRPIVCENDRAELVAGLGCVDYVTLFNEDSPVRLLTTLAPAVYAKGAQYNEDNLPEMETLRSLKTRVAFVPMVDSRSTTSIIDRITETLTL
jgi:rfaE bifunctional protein nucleotidyltransferase chain/domain